MEVCHLCNKEFKQINALTFHYKTCHNYSHIDARKQIMFYNKGLEFPKCPYCNNDVTYTRGQFIRKTCSNNECRSKDNSNRQKKYYDEHPEIKELRRQQRINYLENTKNFEKTAWGIKASNKLSYLEQWFVDNIIIPYKLNEKYDIINERTVSKYFLDFSFENIKLDVELDGKCHFSHGIERVKHDFDRDKYLESLGWKIYRITYDNIHNNSLETIKNFIDFLNNKIDYKCDYEKRINLCNKIFISNKEFKELKNNETIKLKQEQENKKQEEIKQLYNNWYNTLKNSNINFQQNGWKTNSMNLLKITKKQLYKFLDKTSFIKDLNCFINPNMKGSLGQIRKKNK